MRPIIFSLFLVASYDPAKASIPEYCAAYARDIADMSSSAEDWQRRHDNAEKTCVARYSAFEVEPEKSKPKTKPKPKLVAAEKPILEVEPAPKVKPEAKSEDNAKIVAKAIPDLESGSPEWLDYCKQKYVSFDEAKGTYTSKTGVERKCMVTAD